jgi:hypothetical protein
VDLPEPFAKPAEATTEFALTAELQGQGRGLGPLRLQYGNHSAAFALTRSNTEGGALQLTRGELKFGAADAALPDTDGVRIAGRLPVFAWDAWRDLLDGGEPTGLLRALDMDIDSLNALPKFLRRADPRKARCRALDGDPGRSGHRRFTELPATAGAAARTAAFSGGRAMARPIPKNALIRLLPPLDIDVSTQFRA